MNNPWVHLAKYGVVAIIWSGVLIFGIALVQTSSLNSSDTAVPLGIAAFITAAVSTGMILTQPGEHSAHAEKLVRADDASKRKNDQRGSDPISLLTDEDIEELRQEVKENMRRWLMDGGDAVSFESLLAEQEERRRR